MFVPCVQCWQTLTVWKQQHWSVRMSCRSWMLHGWKGYWRTPFLPTVPKCHALCHWLWTRPHTNDTDTSAKAGQSAERANESHTGNHQRHTHWDHEVHAGLPPMQNQTKSRTCQSILRYCRAVLFGEMVISDWILDGPFGLAILQSFESVLSFCPFRISNTCCTLTLPIFYTEGDSRCLQCSFHSPLTKDRQHGFTVSEGCLIIPT